MTTKQKKSIPKDLRVLMKKAVSLQQKIDACRAHYAKLDVMIETLLDYNFTSAKIDGRTVRLVDRFAKKNTVWKSTAQRRFELEVE